ncbi:hypothetical protein RFI_21410 [Reticulomyxa filosa]|uniref:AAA+ ATPase domain-containing protein n=1 Tax=Reticulomyxa filosa TaxID=46433 RepID=X6MR99_RETFI|nr:hypothetical protein RFI_21410 [Reticulomyxa filosa]|eukprot:ETO15947.1 hypothetical protein RFI_21410 [Reticulomyxa filosa]
MSGTLESWEGRDCKQVEPRLQQGTFGWEYLTAMALKLKPAGFEKFEKKKAGSPKSPEKADAEEKEKPSSSPKQASSNESKSSPKTGETSSSSLFCSISIYKKNNFQRIGNGIQTSNYMHIYLYKYIYISKSEKSSKKEKSSGSAKEQQKSENKGGGEDIPWVKLLLTLSVFWYLFGPNYTYTKNEDEISFQQFKVHMLEAGIVDHVEIVNKEKARVHLKKSLTAESRVDETYDGKSKPRDSVYGRYSPDKVYEFRIGTLSAFENKLVMAQEDMDLPPNEWVPVEYVEEIDVKKSAYDVLTSGPILTVLILFLMFRTLRKMQDNIGVGGFPRPPPPFGGGGGGGGGGRSIFDIARPNAKVINKGEKVKTKFSDVAGLQQAKEEIMEFVSFLKNPEHYTKLGARIPKGALLVGPPGTGKTLLARAVAGEAECVFFSISGSDFVEMFVGVGPSRVRNLFEEARQNAPCIIFIDEIDAVGRKRAKGGFAGGNDERENTLNQLLVEMDGFKSDTGIVVLAGTNRADILDSALIRPGRFDRQIQIEKPDIKGRIEIFKVHCKKIKLEQPIEDVAQRMATLTPGFTGADIANVVNEAALRAARKNKDSVGLLDFYEANDRVIGGLEKRTVMSPKERSLIAHHEAGHAVAGWFLENADPLLKVTIIPRASGALGFAQYLPKELQLYNSEQLYHMICMALGGRIAEEIFFGNISTGAADDLNKVTKIAYSQIVIYGMNDTIGHLSFPPEQNDGIQTYRPYSEKTAEIIDREAAQLVTKAYQETYQLLTQKKDLVAKLASKLLEIETLGHDDLVTVLGERPFKNDSYKDYLVNTKEFAQKYGSEEELLQKQKEQQKQAKEQKTEQSQTSDQNVDEQTKK